MNIELISAIVGAVVAGVLATLTLGIQLWRSDVRQRKFYFDKRLIELLDKHNETLNKIQEIVVKIAAESDSLKRKTLASDAARKLATISNQLMGVDLVKDDEAFGKDTIKLTRLISRFANLPVNDLESHKKGKELIHQITMATVPIEAAINVGRLLKLDAISGHKNRNIITRRKKIGRAIKKWLKVTWSYKKILFPIKKWWDSTWNSFTEK